MRSRHSVGLGGGCVKETPRKILLFLNCTAKHCKFSKFPLTTQQYMSTLKGHPESVFFTTRVVHVHGIQLQTIPPGGISFDIKVIDCPYFPLSVNFFSTKKSIFCLLLQFQL
jgi:hypothetical protein